MKKLLVLLLIIFVNGSVFAQEIYSEVRITHRNGLEILAAEGFAVDHVQFDENNLPLILVSESELSLLQVLDIEHTVTITDYAENYRSQLIKDILPDNQKSALSTDGFDLGSMGGFYTFDEVVAKLDEMKSDFPLLITEKQSIGVTTEGRNIWMVKISDNPEIDEDEPVAYFDALHHAREPLSMAVTINYMFYLLENYETDTTIKYLVDNRELYFVPVVNPDGFVYNETTNPEGGGLWRKNRFETTADCIGVDLNRNYSFAYAENNSCSSTEPCSGIYRGTAAFSEAESSAVATLLSNINPNTAFSTHSTAGTFLMPYGYNTMPPEFPLYSEWASAFLNDNNYTYGTTFQILGYTSCGTTRDYMHSEGIFGWTPEIGGNGFWPLPSTIIDLVDENIRPMLYQSWISGAYIDIQSHNQITPALAGETFELVVEIKNVGLENSTDPVTVALFSDNPLVTFSSEMSFDQVPARTKKDNLTTPFQISVDPDIDEQFFDIEIRTFQGTSLNESAMVRIFIGDATPLFVDDGSVDTGNFTNSGSGISWGISQDDSYSGISCYADSPGGNGTNSANTYYELTTPLNLVNATGPLLTFMTKYSLTVGDITRLEVSIDDGDNWEVIAGYYGNESWNMKSYSLADYKGFNQVRIRFHTINDDFRPSDGFYFDDFSIIDYNEEILSTLQFQELKLQISPNPFSDRLEINNPINETLSITMYDILGNSITKVTSDSNKTIVLSNLSGLSQGVYFLKVVTDNGVSKTFKAIKK